MNNSSFTTWELRKAIPSLIKREGMTESKDLFNSDLVEFNKNEPIIITEAEETNGIVDVLFEQIFEGSEDGYYDTECFRYQTIQESSVIRKFLNEC
jgi:hypothetical protein